jgi:hypothetical protein
VFDVFVFVVGFVLFRGRVIDDVNNPTTNTKTSNTRKKHCQKLILYANINVTTKKVAASAMHKCTF